MTSCIPQFPQCPQSPQIQCFQGFLAKLPVSFSKMLCYNFFALKNTYESGEEMGNLTLYREESGAFTAVSNCFIDEYMSEANDAQLKVYLYLLRCLQVNRPTGVSEMADLFNHTEKDILRALKYWEKRDCFPLIMTAPRRSAQSVCSRPQDLRILSLRSRRILYRFLLPSIRRRLLHLLLLSRSRPILWMI